MSQLCFTLPDSSGIFFLHSVGGLWNAQTGWLGEIGSSLPAALLSLIHFSARAVVFSELCMGPFFFSPIWSVPALHNTCLFDFAAFGLVGLALVAMLCNSSKCHRLTRRRPLILSLSLSLYLSLSTSPLPWAHCDAPILQSKWPSECISSAPLTACLHPHKPTGPGDESRPLVRSWFII